MKKIDLTSKRIISGTPKKAVEREQEITNMRLDPRYLRQSSALIQDALQKGFDVLQLANGDIVTTGTKTVVYQYRWENDKGKITTTKPEASRKAQPLKAPRLADEVEEEGSEDAD